MGIALVIGLIVAVVTLSWVAASQSKTINKYEDELVKKASQPTVTVRKTKKNATK